MNSITTTTPPPTSSLKGRGKIALALLLFFSACAPHAQPYIDPPAEQAHLTHDMFVTADGAQLPYHHWLPKTKPKAVIVALHGFDDYSHAFEGTGEFLQAHGVSVYAYDQRGFGAAPNTGIWAGEENLTHDLAQFVRQVQRRHPKTPIYILGESMGGAVVTVAVAQPDFPKVSGIILSAPALWGGDAMSGFYRGTLWVGAHTLPYWKFTGENLHIMASDNIPMLRALGADPLVIKATRLDTIYGLVRLMDDAYDGVPNIHTPVLLLYGAHDQVIPRPPIERSRKRFAEPIGYIYYPDGYHMLLRDLEGEKVMGDILEWTKNQKHFLPPEE